MNEPKQLTEEETKMLAAKNDSYKLVKSFKGTETYMAKNGTMMERDLYYLIPESALKWPNPHQYSVAVTEENERPIGKLFKGKNRKERRKEQKLKNK